MIVDDGSANGTAVNNVRLVKGAQTLLRVDDELVLGFPNASSVAGGGRLDRKQRDGACVIFKIVAAPNAGMAGPSTANVRAAEAAKESGVSKKRKRRDGDTAAEAKGREVGEEEEEDETQDRKVQAKEAKEEEQVDEGVRTALRCPICLDAPAAAAHLSCGHTVCFTVSRAVDHCGDTCRMMLEWEKRWVYPGRIMCGYDVPRGQVSRPLILWSHHPSCLCLLSACWYVQCIHARFFHQNIEDASAHGFPERVRQCPIDRCTTRSPHPATPIQTPPDSLFKPLPAPALTSPCPVCRKSVTHVCRSLLVDALVDELNGRPVPIVSPEDRPSWDARRKEGAQLAAYYEARLRSNPRCLVALPAQYIVVLSPNNRHNVHDRASAKCKHCG